MKTELKEWICRRIGQPFFKDIKRGVIFPLNGATYKFDIEDNTLESGYIRDKIIKWLKIKRSITIKTIHHEYEDTSYSVKDACGSKGCTYLINKEFNSREEALVATLENLFFNR